MPSQATIAAYQAFVRGKGFTPPASVPSDDYINAADPLIAQGLRPVMTGTPSADHVFVATEMANTLYEARYDHAEGRHGSGPGDFNDERTFYAEFLQRLLMAGGMPDATGLLMYRLRHDFREGDVAAARAKYEAAVAGARNGIDPAKVRAAGESLIELAKGVN